MKISDFLSPNQVMIDVRTSDKSRLLEQLSTEAAAAAGLAADEVVREIAKREELGSTGVGNGVALPHAQLASLKAPFALLARLRHPIDFDAIDGEPVDIVVLLLIPEACLRLGARRIGMDRVSTEAELDRRQGTAGRHIQGGQPLSPLAARGRSIVRDPASQAGRLYAPGLARRADGPPAD